MKHQNAIQVFEETQVRTLWDADQEYSMDSNKSEENGA
jgi:hypothetical protein